MSEFNEEALNTLEESNPEMDFLDKVKTYKQKYDTPETSENFPESNTPSQDKIIQIVVGEEGIPSIQYNGSSMSVAEVIGILDMSKEILLKKTIGNTLLQQNLYNMMQGLSA